MKLLSVVMATVLTIITLNVNCIQNTIKWAQFEDFIKTNNADIILIQEISAKQINLTCPYNVYINAGTCNRGTAIITKPGLELTNIACHPDGRIITGKLKDTLIVNIYAPSGSRNRIERNEFFRQTILPYINNGHDRMIIGGDFNCILQSKDTQGRNNMCWPLQLLVENLKLKDATEILHIQGIHYTYIGHPTSSRIDRFYMSQCIGSNLYNYKTITVSFSNHKAVIIQITNLPKAKEIGPGYWKLNCSLLSNQMIIDDFQRNWKLWHIKKSLFSSLTEWWETYAKKNDKEIFSKPLKPCSL